MHTNEQLFFANDLGEIRIIDRLTFQEKNILAKQAIQNKLIETYHTIKTIWPAPEMKAATIIWDLNTLRSSKEFKGSVSQINDIEHQMMETKF
ncbi:MAG: hypothetical protein IPO32_12035 [Crocinitomicaceae bacterium]|nr:hypothetical protein [Crocinitomicaceae bacterium]